jgi:hypothetical protein
MSVEPVIPESDASGEIAERALGVAPEPTQAPPSRRAVRNEARLRARKVQRVIRHVDPWSVLKVSVVFYFCLWLIVTVAGFILWRVVVATGTIDSVESFVAELTSNESYDIDGGQILRASAVAGLILVFAGSALTVMMTVLFNLLSDITGGIRLAVVELETAEPAPRRTRRRGFARRGAAEVDADVETRATR